MSKISRQRLATGAPESYNKFINDAKILAVKRGLIWHMTFNNLGDIEESSNWDLRVFTENNARHAARLNSFAVDDTVRNAAIAQGYSEALLPQGCILGEPIQDFLKAVAAHRSNAKIVPKTVRSEISVLRKLFSSTNKYPWQLNSEDIVRYKNITKSDSHERRVITMLIVLINENMLSQYIPLLDTIKKKASPSLERRLEDRRGKEKLPEPESLSEFVRITFQELPRGHQDLIRFGIARVLILTGLRLNEVIMLPADCLQWDESSDSSIADSADNSDQKKRTLRLKYFGEKRAKQENKFLVPDFQFIPEKFQELVATTVHMILTATEILRHALKTGAVRNRQYKVADGTDIGLENFLFLVISSGKGELPKTVTVDTTISISAESSFLAFIGGEKRVGRETIFARYSDLPNKSSLAIKSHSLRHLMNTEMFRLNVPDTVITQHFGRQSVAQSHVYDHRSLAERLANVEIPASAIGRFPPGTAQETVAKIAFSEAFSKSSISLSFRKIQADQGDEAAFQYLVQSGDGFHATPYGFCITSFAINPCVRYLKCFDNCRHFVASGMPEHKVSLESLRGKIRLLKDSALAKPLTSVGRKNQVLHAEKLISGIDRALASQPGASIFENGSDHSIPVKDLFK